MIEIPAIEGAACADPQFLAVVDAAFDRPGQAKAAMPCRHCPCRSACLDWAMHHREFGVWGGTSPHERTRHGGPRAGAA